MNRGEPEFPIGGETPVGARNGSIRGGIGTTARDASRSTVQMMRRWMLRLRGGRVIGPGQVILGRRVRIARSAIIDARGARVVIGDRAWVGPEVTITTGDRTHRESCGAVMLGTAVLVEHGAIILPGVEVGAGALVGAGAIVHQSVEPNAIMSGRPARRIGRRVLEPAALEFAAPQTAARPDAGARLS